MPPYLPSPTSLFLPRDLYVHIGILHCGLHYWLMCTHMNSSLWFIVLIGLIHDFPTLTLFSSQLIASLHHHHYPSLHPFPISSRKTSFRTLLPSSLGIVFPPLCFFISHVSLYRMYFMWVSPSVWVLRIIRRSAIYKACALSAMGVSLPLTNSMNLLQMLGLIFSYGGCFTMDESVHVDIRSASSLFSTSNSIVHPSQWRDSCM